MNLKKKKRKKILVLFYAVFLVCAFIFGKKITVFAEEIDPTKTVDGDYFIGDYITTGTIIKNFSLLSLTYEMKDGTFTESTLDDTYTIKDGNKNIKLWKIKDLSYYYHALVEIHLVAVTDFDYTDPKDQTVANYEQAIMKTEVYSQEASVNYEWFQRKKVIVPPENFMNGVAEYTKNSDGSINFDIGEVETAINFQFPFLSSARFFMTIFPREGTRFGIPPELIVFGDDFFHERLFVRGFDPTKPLIAYISNASVKDLKVEGVEVISTGVTSNILKLSNKENEEFFEDGNEFFCRITTGDGEKIDTKLATLNIIDKKAPEPEKDNQGSINNPETSATIFIAMVILFIVIGLSGFVIYQKRKNNS